MSPLNGKVPCVMIAHTHARSHTHTHTHFIMRVAICLVAVTKLLALDWGCFKAQTPLAITQVICQWLVINVSLIERAGGAKSEKKTAILIERDKDKHGEWLHFYLLIHHPVRGALTGSNLLRSNSLSGCCIYEVPSKQWHFSRHSDHTLSSLLSLCLCLCVQVCVWERESAERLTDPCFSRSEGSFRVSIVDCQGGWHSVKFS